MKKTVKVIFLCVLVLLVIIGFFYLKPSKTLDFSGEVIKIENINGIYTFNTKEFTYTIVADKDTRIKPCHKEDPEISIEDIKVGDIIEGDYKKISFKENEARYIRVRVQTDN